MLFRLLLLFSLLLPLPAAAQVSRSSLEGSWALQINGATIFRFDLKRVAGKEGEWTGTWIRPSRFSSDGDNFGSLQLPARTISSMAGLEVDNSVEISFPDPRPQAIPDIFRFELVDGDAAEMIYVGTGLAPYLLHRVAADTPLGPFRAGATYSRIVPAEAPVEPGHAPEPGPASNPRQAPLDVEEFRLPPGGSAGR